MPRFAVFGAWEEDMELERPFKQDKTMKANELMIGDWVKVRHLNRIGKVYRLDCANGEANGLVALIDGDFGHSDIDPIPLTPEILEKNGFELGGILKNTYSFGDSNYTITIDKYGRGQCDIMNHLFHIGVTMECCGTVHELQHALRLCGIDKEIVL